MSKPASSSSTASSTAKTMKDLQAEAAVRADIDSLYAKKHGDGATGGETSVVGDECMRKAAKKLDAFFNKSKNAEKALTLYEQAAAAYKMNENWREAADALAKAAELHEKAKEKLEAANKYAEAGLCMARVDNEEAIKLLDMSISIHTLEGRLGAAAKVWKELGELYEDEEQLQEAIEAWKKAADCHESENTLANALQCYLHCAELHVKEYQFKKASKLYEKCAEICIDKNINKGSLRDYFYNALLCQFVVSARKGNLKNLTSMFTRFLESDRKFTGTWQERLIRGCMAAFETDDVKEFSQCIYDQNKIHPLDDLTTRILLEIKKIMQTPREGDEADEAAADLQ